MRRVERWRSFGSELLPLALILASLAGTLGLVVAMHRRSAQTQAPKRPESPPTVVVAPEPERPEPVEPEPPPPPPVAVKPAEDPTKPILSRLAAKKAEQEKQAKEADRQAEAFESAIKAAEAESGRWRSREESVRTQVDDLTARAERMEQEADALARERDVLAQELDAAKAALTKARAKNGGYAVMPHKGANGTWQRPVMVECRDGKAILQPRGIAFTMMDMSPYLDVRSPLVVGVASELVRAQRSGAPDGSAVVPYIYFVVRPDGIRPFYEARASLEKLGIAFGYELVDQDWDIDFPNLDELTAWDGSATARPKAVAVADTGPGGYVWPARRPGGPGTGTGTGSGGPAASPFVWPTKPPGQPGGDGGFVGTPSGLVGDNPSDAFPGRDGGGGLSGSPPGRSGGGGLPPRALAPGTGGEPGGSPASGPTDSRPRGRSGPSGSDGLIPLDPSAFPGLDPSGPAEGGPPPSGDGRDGPGGPDGAPPSLGTGRLAADGRRGQTGPSDTDPTPGTGGGTSTQPSYGTPRGARGIVRPSAGDGRDQLEGQAGEPAPTPPGRVRIDPDEVARLAEGFDQGDPAEAPPPLPPNLSVQPPGQTASASASDSAPPPPLIGMGSTKGSTPGTSVGSGMTSTSPSQSPGQPSSGIGLPSIGQTSPSSSSSSSASGSSFGSNSPAKDSQNEFTPPPPKRPTTNPSPIDVPLDLTVACGPNGLTIHPGGYRLSMAALKKDGMLKDDLRTIVRNHELIDPMVRPQPRIEFLIEPGGGAAYQLARKQTMLSGLDWPVTFRVADSTAPRVFNKERY